MIQELADSSKIKRRLAAIAFADVAGFSDRSGRDGTGTMLRWKALREAFLAPKIAEHGGTLLQVLGDGLLIEFASAVDAVRWADEVQRGIALQRITDPDMLQMRIAVNVEDIIIDGDLIHGDGVNIAARVQQIANAGDVLLTATVRDYVWNKIAVDLTDLGEREFKNIGRPIRIYRLERQGDTVAAPRRFSNPHLSWNNRPSIAVLPFENIGGNAHDAYFGEGITEDIIAALSVNRSLLVIARNSALPYRGRRTDPRQIASELGVRYLLDGSVRHHGAALRISVELIDAGKNLVIWGRKYDGSSDDIFAFQDRIAAAVAGTIEPQLYGVEAARVRTKPTDSLDAYDCMLRAFPLYYSTREEEFMAAGTFLDRAIALDASYAQAIAYKAWWYVLLMGEWRARSNPSDAQTAITVSQRALRLDATDAFVIAVAAHVESFLCGEPESAAEMFDRALEINENSAFAWGLSAVTACYLGRPDDALQRLRAAWRLSPFDPMTFFFLGVAGLAEFVAGHYDEALVWLLKTRRENPGHLACHRNLAACFAQLGRMEEARAAAGDLLAREPGFRVGEFARRYPLRDKAALDRLVAALRVAGLPD